MTHFRPAHLSGLIVLLPGLLVTACQLQLSESAKPSVPGGWTNPFPADADVWPAPDWWHGFGSLELDQLITTARSGNYDITAAAARVLQAEAQARIAGVELLPSVDLGASAARAGDTGTRNNTTNIFDISLGASYEVDFWGKNRANLYAAQESLKASIYDQETVALTVITGVATTYFQILSLREQIAIARFNLTNAEELLKVVESRVQNGAVPPLDLALQNAEVARQRAIIPPLEQEERIARFTLATLLGRPPQGFDLATNNLEMISYPRVAPGLPSELLIRRPDIASAEAQLSAANADITAARAAFFPSIQLTGSGGLLSTSLSALFSNGLIYNLAVSLTRPIFDAGLLVANEDLARARQNELVQRYLATIINAFADVETALGAIRSTTEQQSYLLEELEQSQIAYRLAESRYKEGAEDLTTVLVVQRTLYQSQDQNSQVRFSRLQSLISLYRSLGGGWKSDNS
jgi:NodT family efflux transporter outer membrane factor (OMF) lipoprotein